MGLISQASAARLLGVSRQRVNELVKQGRLELARDESGELLGGLWEKDVLSLDLKPVGRPCLSQEELDARRGPYDEDEIIVWHTTAFGHPIHILGKVIKTTAKRVKIEIDWDDDPQIKWVPLDQCETYIETKKFPESGKNIPTANLGIYK